MPYQQRHIQLKENAEVPRLSSSVFNLTITMTDSGCLELRMQYHNSTLFLDCQAFLKRFLYLVLIFIKSCDIIYTLWFLIFKMTTRLRFQLYRKKVADDKR